MYFNAFHPLTLDNYCMRERGREKKLSQKKRTLTKFNYKEEREKNTTIFMSCWLLVASHCRHYHSLFRFTLCQHILSLCVRAAQSPIHFVSTEATSARPAWWSACLSFEFMYYLFSFFAFSILWWIYDNDNIYMTYGRNSACMAHVKTGWRH